jgi:hypothetical protein
MAASGAVFTPYEAPPAEAITLDKWFAPLSGPTRRIPIPWQQLVRPEMLPPPPTNWQQPLAEPVRRDPVAPWFQPTATDTLPRVATNWQTAFSEPVRVKPAVIWQAPTAFEPLPRVATNWQQPLSEPVRLRATPAAQQQAIFAEPGLPRLALGWQQPLAQPTLRRAAPQQADPAFVYVEAAVAETITPDKWHAAFSQPYVAKTFTAALHLHAVIDPAETPPNPVVADTVDTHDGGDARRRRDPNARQPWNKQPMPSLAQLRKLLGLDKKATPAAIEAKADEIEAAAEALEGEAPAPVSWEPPPVDIQVNTELPRMLALASRALEQARATLDAAQNEARRRAAARYEQALVELAAAIKARQDEDEEDELIALIAAGVIN